jgi:hypothetical protein
MVTIEQMVGPYLRAGNLDAPEEQALSAAAVLRAMKKCSSYSHNDDLFFQDLLVELRFGTDYTIDQCRGFQARIEALWVEIDVVASSDAEPTATPTKRTTRPTKTKTVKNTWPYDPTYNAPDHTWILGYSYTRNGKEVSVRCHWRASRTCRKKVA